ncbi:MAG: hypothetical protein HC935_03740 [Pseudanabaena sp. SU_2_4]|nr:hypothetical protein [Pseudanabaena sp. SU_2_4]
MENPLLPGASNAIGAALNPTFPTGPANIITPQTDAGHGLSGSGSAIALPLVPTGSGSKGIVMQQISHLPIVKVLID